MSRLLWWVVITVLNARCLGQVSSRTICEDESCRCDAFTRVICNCTKDYDEVTIRPDGEFRIPSTTTGIIINGCARVFFLSNTVNHLLGLRTVELRNNHHVQLSERALAWSPRNNHHELGFPGLRISIHNCTIHEIASHAVKGYIDDILISGSIIHMIRPFAFSSLASVQNIDLYDNIIENIEIQAFKNFRTTNFNMKGGEIKRAIPSRFLSDVEITNVLRIDGVIINSISSLAFLANSPKRILVERNYIRNFEGDAFHIATRGPVSFRNNTIETMNKGALLGISVQRDIISNAGLQEMIFENNTVTYVTPSAFAVNRSAVIFRIDSLNINVSCHCDLGEIWEEILTEQGGVIKCWYSLEELFMSIPIFLDSRCGTFKENFWIFIVVGILIVVIIGIIVGVIVIRREKQKKKKLAIVLPDGKTYRETEFHIVVERAELLTTDL